jgi:hypothetical protein
LFSYRADAPPAGEQARGQQSGGKPVYLTDLFEVAAEAKMFSSIGVLDVATEAQMLERLRARKSADVDDAVHIGPTPVKEKRPNQLIWVPSRARDDRCLQAADSTVKHSSSTCDSKSLTRLSRSSTRGGFSTRGVP